MACILLPRAARRSEHAALIEGGTRFKRLRDAIYEKYPQYPEESALEKGAVIVEITPRYVFSQGFE